MSVVDDDVPTRDRSAAGAKDCGSGADLSSRLAPSRLGEGSAQNDEIRREIGSHSGDGQAEVYDGYNAALLHRLPSIFLHPSRP